MLPMTTDEIESHLAEARIGRLCMASPTGQPYVIPMPFCWHEDALYLRLPMVGRKGALLSQNQSVCFEIDWFTDSLDDYGSVLIEGRLEPVADLDEKAAAKQANDQKYHRLRRGHRPGHGRTTPLQALALQKITVFSLSGRKRMPAAPPAMSAIHLKALCFQK